MNQLYLLGGPPRTGKSTIMSTLAHDKHIPVISTDAVQEGLRNVFINEPYQMLRSIEFSGSAEYKSSVDTGGNKKQFEKKSTETDLAREAVLGMLDHYARNNSDVAVEGSIVTPDWADELDTEEFTVHAAFVGYTRQSHADTVLAYAKSHPRDWIAEWLEIERGDETRIRAWIAKQAEQCKQVQSDAEGHGYPFFDISTQPFERYIGRVSDYFQAGSR